MVACSSSMASTLSRSLQNVHTGVLPRVYGRADYTQSVCVLKHDISPFIESERQNMLDIMHGKCHVKYILKTPKMYEIMPDTCSGAQFLCPCWGMW